MCFCVTVDVINGLFGTFGTNNNICRVCGLTTSRKENCNTSLRSFREAGGLTYCISADWERTSNLTLLLPSSRASRSGNNSFSDCWSSQCPWYWKLTASGVSNLQSKQFKTNFNSLDLFVYLLQLVLLIEELYVHLNIGLLINY